MKRAITIAAMLAAAGLAGAQMFAQLFGGETWTPAALGPIAWYKGENNALDSTGANNGTWAGTETYATGVVGSAFSFDGSDKRVTSALVIPEGDATISAWAKPTTFSNYRVIAGAGAIGKVTGMSLFLSSSEWFAQTRMGTTIIDVSSAHGSISAFTHVVGVRGGGRLKLYVNGILTNDMMCAISPITPVGSFGIGARLDGTWGYRFVGQIDDVLIFNRALTATEVKKLYDESALKNGAAW